MAYNLSGFLFTGGSLLSTGEVQSEGSGEATTASIEQQLSQPELVKEDTKQSKKTASKQKQPKEQVRFLVDSSVQ